MQGATPVVSINLVSVAENQVIISTPTAAPPNKDVIEQILAEAYSINHFGAVPLSCTIISTLFKKSPIS